MLSVHLRINDLETSQPTPVRLSLSGPDGSCFAPFGRLADFATGRHEDVGAHLRLGSDRFCYIDGSCEVKLPAGVPIRVRASKGPEYPPLDETVTLGSGQMALRFSLQRRTQSWDNGWYAGDTRVHTLSPHAALLEGAAEDVAVVNLLAQVQDWPSLDGRLYPSLPNLTAFSGQTAALQSGRTLVAVNTRNTHPVLGSVAMLHAHRVVYPLSFGSPDATDDWSVCDWCDQCHRKRGLTVWTQPFDTTGGEALVALVLGKIDAIEVTPAATAAPILPAWYRLLNAGFRVPLVGASAKDSNTVPIGAMRTYAQLRPEDPFTYTNWIEAVRAGRCFVTNGPFVSLAVNGVGPGSVLDLPEGTHTLPVRVSDDTEVVVQGVPQPRGSDSVTVSTSGWIAARSIRGFAHTAPVWVQVTNRPLPHRAAALPALRKPIEATRDWVETTGQFVEDKSRRHLLDLCDQALARLNP